MTELQKALIIPLALVILIPASILLYFAENIKGYYRFKWYCENEGGLKIYEKLEKNVGWMAEDKLDAMAASHLKYVKFVRYPEKKEQGKLYDLVYQGGNPSSFKSHEITPANFTETIKYKWVVINSKIENELRLEKYGYEIFYFENSNYIAKYYSFGYSIFNRKKTFLSAPSGSGCFNEPGMWKKEINKIFKN
ncbi:MAG: hypothetical protein ACI82Z_001722 [Cellvibrionaceae bacterium]|jgi:hypothetical protein